jgi:hypothetical protein
VGCPIRISTDQRLLAAPRGFSQRATSFIASWCQGIHRMPFLYSISRPLPERRGLTMHRNHPQDDSCQGSVVSCQRHACPKTNMSEATVTGPIDCFENSPGNIYSAHNRIFSNRPAADRSRDPPGEKFDKIVHNASEPSPPTVGALSSQRAIPGQTIRPDNGSVVGGSVASGQSKRLPPANNAQTPDTRAQRRTRT